MTNQTTRPTLMTAEGIEAFRADRKAKLAEWAKDIPIHPVHPGWFDEAQRLRAENERLRDIIRKAASELAHRYDGEAFQMLCDVLEETDAV